jgi:hypothetical protein
LRGYRSGHRDAWIQARRSRSERDYRRGSFIENIELKPAFEGGPPDDLLGVHFGRCARAAAVHRGAPDVLVRCAPTSRAPGSEVVFRRDGDQVAQRSSSRSIREIHLPVRAG